MWECDFFDFALNTYDLSVAWTIAKSSALVCRAAGSLRVAHHHVGGGLTLRFSLRTNKLIKLLPKLASRPDPTGIVPFVMMRYPPVEII